MLLFALLIPEAGADGLYASPGLYTVPAAAGTYVMPVSSPVFTAFTGYINGYRINVRVKPGTTSSVCGVVSCGDCIHVTNQSYCTGGRLWYYGTIGSICGWVYSGYVSGAPVPASCVTAVTSCAVPAGYGTICMNATNFRSGPGMYYASLMQLSRGTVVQLLCAVSDISGTVWYQVLTGGCTGWVRSDLITTAGCASYGTAMPYSTAASFTGYTNTNAVNVRATPNGTKIAQVSRGSTVYVYGIVCQCGVYWYQVSFYGGMGYIRADLVTIGTCPNNGVINYGVGGVNYYDYSGSTSITITDGSLSSPLPGTYGAYGETDPYGYGYTQPQTYGYGDGYDYAQPQGYGYGYASDYSQPQGYGYGNASEYTQPQDYGYADASGYGQSEGYGYAPESTSVMPRANLSFATCTLTSGQSLPVYTAPNAAGPRADSGTAQLTLTESLYAAGFDGQWLLVMYRNQNQMTRVGYVNAFQLQGTLPNLQSLAFSQEKAMVICRTSVTSDPMEQTDALVMLNAGDSVTWLANLTLNGEWAYVETMYNGAPVRGFIPLSALR